MPWRAKASPQSAQPTVPLSREALSRCLNWNLRSSAKVAGCQAGSVGPVGIDSSPSPCFLSVSDPCASFDSSLSQLQIPRRHHHAARAPRIETDDTESMSQGRSPAFSIIQLNSLNARGVQIVDSAFSARSVGAATHTWNLSTVFLSVGNEGKRLDREPEGKIIKCGTAEPVR